MFVNLRRASLHENNSTLPPNVHPDIEQILELVIHPTLQILIVTLSFADKIRIKLKQTSLAFEFNNRLILVSQ